MPKIEVSDETYAKIKDQLGLSQPPREGTPVLVTTEARGVFFGYLPDGNALEEGELTLEHARNCVYWSSDVKGFLGLAKNGPSGSCRIGPAVGELTLYKITSVAKVSPEAVVAWEKAPWE